MKFKKSIVSLMAVTMLGGATLPSISVYASENEKTSNIIQNEEEVVDIQQMSEREYQQFEKFAQEEAERADLPNEEATKAFKEALIGVYDQTSPIYHNVEKATDQLSSYLPSSRAKHGTISVKFLASSINLGITALSGFSAGAGIKALVKKYGAKKAANKISTKIVAILWTFGIKKVSGLDSMISTIVKNLLDPGTYIAKQIDKKDKIKNNGWIELW